MATAALASTSVSATFVARTSLSQKASCQTVNGLPSLHRTFHVPARAAHKSGVVCSANEKFAPVAAASAAISFATAHPALALVDERLSTEGTGLALGLSNGALGWLLFGTFGVVWALYYTFSKGLPEGDDDSGLSL
ncbi:photosystem II subunit W [Klebsormidium nitens]|uniref:PSII 6.1 kDa protein n=1 Tax=Klebsormidium nitens TaxID=105231 RepID=A0A1Y1ILV4_KLENI|nr:photosystem II subunit W [Klebsormidium nitens]|eukprot:GAQ90429.1 photosystem II subunit W [Klebsormidium nitens]